MTSAIKILRGWVAGMGTVSRPEEDILVINARFETVDRCLEIAELFEAKFGWTVAVRS